MGKFFLAIIIAGLMTWLTVVVATDNQNQQDQTQVAQQSAQKAKEQYLVKHNVKDSVPTTQYETEYVPAGDIGPELSLQNWIISHPEFTIIALGTDPLQGGISGVDVVYENKAPSFHYRVDSYLTMKDVISQNKNRKIIAIATVNGWRGSVASEIVLSSPDDK